MRRLPTAGSTSSASCRRRPVSSTTIAAGNVLPEGDPVRRRYASDEYEFYAQDSWRLGDKLTAHGRPPLQPGLPAVRDQRPPGGAERQPRQVVRSARPDDGPGHPRQHPASPSRSTSRVPRTARRATTTGTRTTSRRASRPRGGRPTSGSFGVATRSSTTASVRRSHRISTSTAPTACRRPLDSAFGINDETVPDIRFTGITALPPTLPSAPAGGFPATPIYDNFTIYSSLDDTLKTPYAHTFNLVVGHELGKVVQHRSRVCRPQGPEPARPARHGDAAGPQGSGVRQRLLHGVQGRDHAAREQRLRFGAVTPVAYFENMFPDAAFGGRSATQNIADEYAFYYPDFTSALLDMDFFCSPSCTKFGPYSYFNGQFFSLAAQSTIARSDYNAMQLTLRKRYSNGYQFDVNYTFAHSKDHGSAIERGSSFTRVRKRRLYGLPHQLVGTRPAVRQLRLRHPPPAERQLGRGASLRPGPEVREEQLGSRELDHRRLERRRTLPA